MMKRDNGCNLDRNLSIKVESFQTQVIYLLASMGLIVTDLALVSGSSIGEAIANYMDRKDGMFDGWINYKGMNT